MKNIFLTLLLLVVLPLTLDARRNGEGLFIGVGGGATYYNDGGMASDIDADLTSVSGAYKLYGGYKYDHEFTLEGSFTGYGKYEVTKDGKTEDTLTPMSAAVYLNYGSDFVHNQIRPFAIIGAGVLWLSPANDTLYDSPIFFSLHYGAGLLWTPRQLDGLGFRVAYEGDWSEFDTTRYVKDMGGDGSYYNFIGTLYLGVQYKF